MRPRRGRPRRRCRRASLAVALALLPAAIAAPTAAADPRASFDWPRPVVAGVAVTLHSTSEADPFAPIVESTWDLDDDGEFDDATGDSVSWTFADPGRVSVGLQVQDSLFGFDTTRRRITVDAPKEPMPPAEKPGESAAPPAPPPPPAAPGVPVPVVPSGTTPALDQAPAFMTPFPVVRIVGTASPRGTRVTLLSINAPARASYAVRCRGRGCPFAIRSLRRIGPDIDGTRTVQLRSFRRRLLRRGAVVVVRITQPGHVGKYTSFRIRGHAAPLRRDRCLRPSTAGIFRC